MTTLVLNYFHQPVARAFAVPFQSIGVANKGDVHRSSEDQFYTNTAVACSCCGWKGKIGQTQRKYLFVNAISEIEYFCPDCDAYLGFIADSES